VLAQQLVGAAERVIDVQPKLAARVRLLDNNSVNKNDPHDARSVAIAALRSPAPGGGPSRGPLGGGQAVVQTPARPSPGRNKVACRLHSLLCELVPGGVADEIYAAKAAKLLGYPWPEGIDTRNSCAEVNKRLSGTALLLRARYERKENKDSGIAGPQSGSHRLLCTAKASGASRSTGTWGRGG
jgi:hypothetical protein